MKIPETRHIETGSSAFRTGTNRMKSSALRTRVAMPLLVLALMFVAPALCRAQDPFAGRVTAIDSSSGKQVVNIIRVGKKGLVKAKLGDALFVGDSVKTGSGVKATIELSDKSTINMGENSVFVVKAYVLDHQEAKRNYTLKALKGTIRFIISKAFKNGNGASSYWRDSNVNVETATAVAGIRGTDFVIIIDTSSGVPQVRVLVLEGVVTVRNILVSVKGAVTLSANQESRVESGEAPAGASPVSSSILNSVVDSTTPAPGSGTSNGASTGQQTSTAQYTASDMERDLNSGTPLSEVLDRAMDSGMTQQEAIAAALQSGMPAVAVVYAAITGGYSPTAVIEAAITAGAPLSQVVAAAMVSGAETSTITGGAQLAGVSPEVIASAIAAASSNTQYVYTYSQDTSDSGSTSGSTSISTMIYYHAIAPLLAAEAPRRAPESQAHLIRLRLAGDSP